ncbi:uncharacterized protein METZ01_LOCUS271042, partial [marine metagenome]
MARHCGHCYTRGHNRRSCPEIRKAIRDDPNGYHARAAREQKERAARNPRRCSYCKETGHNKKTCPTLKAAISKCKEKNYQWRKKFLDISRGSGFGVGSLVRNMWHTLDKTSNNAWQIERHEDSANKLGEVGLVLGFASEKMGVDLETDIYGTGCVRVLFAKSGRTRFIQLPSNFAELVPKKESPYEIGLHLQRRIYGY